MDIIYWTFPNRTGKWSIAPGNKYLLVCGDSSIGVVWKDEFPVSLDGYIGTRWVGAQPVQQGVTVCKPPEKSGGSVDYYQVRIANPTTKDRDPYTAECNDIIEALGMNYAEGNSFKALWRSCAARTLGKLKAGGDAIYDAEKNVFFAQRILVQLKENNAN